MKIFTNFNLENNQLQNVIIHKLKEAPYPAHEGQIYYNTSLHSFFIYNNSTWNPLPINISDIENDSNFLPLTEDQSKTLNNLLDGLEDGYGEMVIKTANGYLPDENGDVEIPELKELEIAIDMLQYGYLSWEQISQIVRLGVGPKYFPVGYEFSTFNSDENTDIIWVVRGHDHHVAADKNLAHTMTLEMKYVYSNDNGVYKGLHFDAPEALYYAENGLEAGTYNFTWTYVTGSLAKGTYQFTLTKGVPVGGQVVLNMKGSTSAITACKISTYANIGAEEPIESNIAVKTGSSGTNLGTIEKYSSTNNNLNNAQKVSSGSNNYAQSAIDQWLNSSAESGSVWTPRTIFDRPSSENAKLNGFMHGLPEDFLEAVQPAVISCRTNSAGETTGFDDVEMSIDQTYELTRKFFLLSQPEIFGTYDNSNIRDGEVLEYYNSLTNTERIHRDNGGTARATWLRSPNFDSVRTVRIIDTDGSLYYNSAGLFIDGVAAACIIA